jgi:hypothetical protein
MKDKFFKFFEIGKLDKGLFRIWILLTILFYIFFSIQLFTNSSGYAYQKRKSIDMSCAPSSLFKNLSYKGLAADTKIYVRDDRFLIVEILNDGLRVMDRKEFEFLGYTTKFLIFAPYGIFHNIDDCKKYINAPIKRFYSELALIIFLPFSVVFIWLFSKKIFLWIYKGFK